MGYFTSWGGREEIRTNPAARVTDLLKECLGNSLPMMNQTAAREKIQKLIEKFHREEAAGVIDQYNESETKTGFIEPLLQALGWKYQDRNEVGLEEKISRGRVDYSLKIKGSPKDLC